MLNFRNVTLEDKDFVSHCMKNANLRGSDYTFANLFDWAGVYDLKIAEINDFLLIKNGNNEYMCPIGGGDMTPALQAISDDAKENGRPFWLYGVHKENIAQVEAAFPGRFDFVPVRDNFDYIYTRESLATLAGKKLHSKRNHVNKFMALYPDWRYERLDAGNLQEAREMNAEWCKQLGCESQGLKREACAVKSAFDNFFELGLRGGLLRVGDRVVAYTMGSEATEDTFVVHIEKAFPDVEGAYTMINQQFVKNELEKYEYVNREDDVGEPGLRKAKESYQPAMMFERYNAVEKK